RGIAVERQRTDEILEMGGLDTADGKADDLAIATDDLARENGCPDLGNLAHHRLDDHLRRRLSRHELPEITPFANALVPYRPHLGRIDQPALGAPEIQGADMRQHCKFRAQ